jgi:hypothetical protein
MLAAVGMSRSGAEGVHIDILAFYRQLDRNLYRGYTKGYGD